MLSMKEVRMELVPNVKHIELLTVQEMETFEAGAMISWPHLLGGLAAAFITNIPDFFRGIFDGWNAYNQ